MNENIHDSINKMAEAMNDLRKTTNGCPLYCKEKVDRIINCADVLIQTAKLMGEFK